ncbi:MAG: hypothetical protein ACJ8F7_17465, partial [Gemmataceae bacterium]
IERHELLAGWRALTGVPSPPLEVVEFGNQDFTSPCSEQMIRAVRGARADFASGLLFWVKAMEATDRFGPEPYFTTYADAALCESIQQAEFARVVDEYSGSLVPPLPGFVRELAGWRSGRRMYAEWNDVAVVADLAEAFVLFAWSTSA